MFDRLYTRGMQLCKRGSVALPMCLDSPSPRGREKLVPWTLSTRGCSEETRPLVVSFISGDFPSRRQVGAELTQPSSPGA